MKQQTTRRKFIGSTFVAGIATSGLSMSGVAARQQEATPEADEATTPQPTLTELGEVTMPEWVLVVHAYQDPYAGDIAWPAEPREDTRYIGAEVEIRNDSEAPLDFISSSVRLRASDGTEYNAGSAVGAESQLTSRNMAPGDNVRGWAWFTVPDDAEITEIFYIAPSPRLVLALTEDEP